MGGGAPPSACGLTKGEHYGIESYGAVNEELQAYLLRRQYDRQVGQSRRAVCRQYAQLAEVLEDAAAAIAPSLTLLPPKTRRQTLTAVVGVAGRKKAGETVSGDACSWFKEDSGRLCLLLCDGMGSGREARKESELAIDLLEKFLKAGFSPENALKTLDQAFCLRLDEAMGFSTVDLLTLDLCSGEAALYKLGSAPSYLKQGGTVRVLRGRGFPPWTVHRGRRRCARPPRSAAWAGRLSGPADRRSVGRSRGGGRLASGGPDAL